jgi:hypothetical protein
MRTLPTLEIPPHNFGRRFACRSDFNPEPLHEVSKLRQVLHAQSVRRREHAKLASQCSDMRTKTFDNIQLWRRKHIGRANVVVDQKREVGASPHAARSGPRGRLAPIASTQPQ